MVERLFLAVPRGCLQFVIVVFPDHTHLLFLKTLNAPTSTLKTTIGRHWQRSASYIHGGSQVMLFP